MLKAIIIEDEEDSRKLLSGFIKDYCHEVNIVSSVDNVKDGLEAITTFHPDVVFMDIQLKGETSFDLLDKLGEIDFDIIFTTAYESYMLKAIKLSAVDYLLKPIEKEDVSKALWKYKNLQHHFQPNGPQESYSKLLAYIHSAGRSRLLVKRGLENILLKTEDVVLFYTEKKVVFVIDKFSKKYLLDKTLTELENELDQQLFFRANRQYIINLDYVKGFRPFEKVKLQVDLSNDELNHSIIVSQETAQAFKKWIRAS